MNRKNFLSSILASAATIPSLHNSLRDPDEGAAIIPPYLKAGDTIGITSPAGFITREEIQPAVIQMENWGFKIRAGDTIGKRDFGFGGTDAERTADLQQMMDNRTIQAIMCARGGYGSVRIIDNLDFTNFSKHPKWVIGFSDITVLHSHLNRNYGIASIHSKMCNSFPEDWNRAEPMQVETILSIKQALIGQKMIYTIPSANMNRHGNVEGILVGGNLKTIESLAGSRSDIKTGGKILFVEDTGEYLYSIDRMFISLKRTGKLSDLKALIVGGFKIKPDDAGEEFGRTLYEIVWEKVKEYNYPVCFDFPVGHQRNNFAFKCGVMHRLEVNTTFAILKEI
ncbi:MAG: LD-carboxypeptidase [Chitinophagaceae bacterium]